MNILVFVLPTDPLTYHEAAWGSVVPRVGERVGLVEPQGYRLYTVASVLYLEGFEERSCPETYNVVVPGRVKVRVDLSAVEPAPVLASPQDIEERLDGS